MTVNLVGEIRRKIAWQVVEVAEIVQPGGLTPKPVESIE